MVISKSRGVKSKFDIWIELSTTKASWFIKGLFLFERIQACLEILADKKPLIAEAIRLSLWSSPKGPFSSFAKKMNPELTLNEDYSKAIFPPIHLLLWIVSNYGNTPILEYRKGSN